MGQTLHITTVEEFDQLETAMLFTERQVAEKLHIKPCTIRNERLQGAISYIKIRSRYFYTEEQIEEYIRSKTILSKASSPPTVTDTSLPSIHHKSAPPANTLSSAEKDAIKEATLRSARETFRRRPRGVRWRQKPT